MTLLWRRSLSYKNQSPLLCRANQWTWFLYNRDLRHEKIKPFSTNIPFLYPLKTAENQRFSDVFRGYRNGTLVWNWLITFLKHGKKDRTNLGLTRYINKEKKEVTDCVNATQHNHLRSFSSFTFFTRMCEPGSTRTVLGTTLKTQTQLALFFFVHCGTKKELLFYIL